MTMPLAKIETLDAASYVDPENFEAERKRIFKDSWHLIAPTAALTEPGHYITCNDIPLAPWIIIRRKDGSLAGFENICRHRAGPLVDSASGKLSANALTCRYHGWTYRLDGTLAAAPGLSPCPDMPLFSIAVKEWNGMIFAHADPDRDDLADWLGGIVDIAETYPDISWMSYIGAVESHADCNWKAYADNSCEGWHVSFVHETLKDNAEDVDLSCHENGAYILFDVTYRPTEADPTRNGRAHWIYKFPGLLLHFADHTINVETVIPTGPDSISLKRFFWADLDAVEKMGLTGDKIIEASRSVMEEDAQICEKVHRNLQRGRYNTGILVPDREPGTVFFQSLVRMAMAGAGQ